MTGATLMRVLIVDDEPLAHEKIVEMLRDDPEVEIIAGCMNGSEAVEAIEKHSPDLIFLDVQMPERDGFAVLEALEPERMPLVIFVTAYDQYAVRAFEVHAVDYLLKPFDRERFDKAMQRARAQFRRRKSGEIDQRILTLLQEIKARPEYVDRLVIKTGGRVFFLKTDEIEWIEAEGNYVRLHVNKASYLLRETISSLEARLDPRKFRRIHRSTIVNIDSIKELQPWFHGEYQVILQNGAELTLSRSYREKLPELLGRTL
jgi:two-component system LytT family response regulator